MKALFELFRRFDARRIFGFIRRLLGMSRPKVKCYDLLSNHALRVEGDRYPEQYDARFEISIHALRVEGDSMREVVTLKEYYISIHALRVEGDPHNMYAIACTHFISIHALRVEGDHPSAKSISKNFISIHALRVEGDLSSSQRACPRSISIHALRVEGDERRFLHSARYADFYPRPPGGGRLAHTR